MSWQQSLSNAITSLDELYRVLDIDIDQRPQQQQAISSFKLIVPREFVSRMKKGDMNDPLLLQVLPQGAELKQTPGFTQDPLREQQANPLPGLLHKYHGRALMIAAGSCAINCRYCFRRHFPYQANNPNPDRWQQVFAYLKMHPDINELILSGGEPLLLKDTLLSELTTQLETIPSVNTLRIHTRLPVVIPNRITDGLAAQLNQTKLNVVMVIHSNHPNEIDQSVRNALGKLNNVTLLNQSVLLKNINDNATTLIELSHRLFDSHVLPYYLHLLDPVEGTAHFNVPEENAMQLIEEIQKKLPGYLVPKLAREVPDLTHKLVVR